MLKKIILIKKFQINRCENFNKIIKIVITF